MTTTQNFWETIYNHNPDVMARKIVGETLLVPIQGELVNMEHLFVLNAVAEHIWHQIDGHNTLHNICESVITHFDTNQTQAKADVKDFVDELLQAKLII